MEDLDREESLNGVSEKNGVQGDGSSIGNVSKEVESWAPKDTRAREKRTTQLESDFLNELRETQVRQAKSALVDTLVRKARRHMIGTILDELEEDDVSMYELFRMLTLDEIFFAFEARGSSAREAAAGDLSVGESLPRRSRPSPSYSSAKNAQEPTKSVSKRSSDSGGGDLSGGGDSSLEVHGGEDIELLDSDEFMGDGAKDAVGSGDARPPLDCSETFIKRFYEEFPNLPDDTTESRLQVLWSMILIPELGEPVSVSAIADAVSFDKDAVRDALTWGVENKFMVRTGVARGTKYHVLDRVAQKAMGETRGPTSPDDSSLVARPKKKKRKGRKPKAKK